MKARYESLLKFEFEYRIFISLSIVLVTCLISFGFFPETDPLYRSVLKGTPAENLSPGTAYLTSSLIIIVISLMRMWSGSLLSSEVVMTFKVRTDLLSKEGPYLLVRNPIYLADWAAIFVFSLFLPPVGLIMPALFYFHYMRLILFEEGSLGEIYRQDYKDYIKSVPRFFPAPSSCLKFFGEIKKFKVNYDGFRHNALYILFIPGFAAAAYFDNFIYALIIGFPGVIDWAIVHTKIGVEKNKQKKSKVFDDILYSQCWEDPQIDRIAFKINSDDVVFTITSGGCNALTFLLDDPRKIIALDLNPHQNYLLELKIAAMKNLVYDKTLRLFGIKRSDSRVMLYKELRELLSNKAREFWDNNLKKIEKGLIHSGRYEGYMRILGKVLTTLIGRQTINELFRLSTGYEREKIYNEKWDNLRWKIFTRVLLSRTLMSLLFTGDFFRYLDKNFSFGKNFAEKVKYAVTKLPLRENYFLTYILYGNYHPDYLPPYLSKDNYEVIRKRLDRIEIVSGSCDGYFALLPDSTISKFNFTNIFEWLSPTQFENLLSQTIRIAKDRSVITYRNLLVKREHPAGFNDRIHSDRELSRQLHSRDLSFVYDRYVVEEIYKEAVPCYTELLR